MLSIYRASAGSGKTHTLTQEYLLLLFSELQKERDHLLPHSRILAVTFTKKATAEMKERILTALYELSQNPTESKFYKALHEKLHIDANKIQENARKMLIDILMDYNRFSVSTIDGFFQQVIRTFAIDLGLSTTYELALDGKEVVQQAVDDLFRRIKLSQEGDTGLVGWISEFMQENMDASKRWNPHDNISSFAEELLKEEVMRNMNAVQAFFADKDKLKDYKKTLKKLISDFEDDVKQLQQEGREYNLRITEVEGGATEKVKEGVRVVYADILYKSFDYAIGKLDALQNIVNDPTLLHTKSAKKAQQNELMQLYQKGLGEVYSKLAALIEDQLTNYYTAKAILANLYLVGLMQDIAEQVHETNREKGRVPMAEVNQLLYQVIDGQEAPFIYERIGQRMYHYMIDEFQDTSSLQWENFYPLVSEADSKGNDNLIVGDIKQSIYRWRNSDWKLLDTVDKQFRCATPAMEHNWRSAALLIQENEHMMLEYSKWVTDTIEAKGWKDEPLAASIQHIYNEKTIRQKASKNIPGVFHLEFFDNNNKEQVLEQTLESTTQLIRQLTEEEGFTMSQIALLVRRGDDAEILANHLIENGIAVQSAEGMRIQSHWGVQVLVALLQIADADMQEKRQAEKEEEKKESKNPVAEAIVKEYIPILTEEQEKEMKYAKHLPLYEQVQEYIRILKLSEQKSALPYLTAFQDMIYSFTQQRVADVGAFLEYWDRKREKATIPSAPNVDAIRIITIHSSKGLEFDVVILPFLNWDLERLKSSDNLWCRPKKEPFKQLPLVAISAKQEVLKSHFKKDYIREVISQYIDNLNLTYVAFTRPKYRLYAFGQMYQKTKEGKASIQNVGHLLSYLYEKQKREDNANESVLEQIETDTGINYIYHRTSEHIPMPNADEKEKESDNKELIREASYVCSPIQQRLKLRSRAENDFGEDTPLETIDLGILMHNWLAKIITWDDAMPELERMLCAGEITEAQKNVMLEQWENLKALLQREGKEQWFAEPGQVLNEQDILTTSGNTLRPDRVMVNGQKAITIDYKFGQEHKEEYAQQMRKYIVIMEQMGYQVEAYLVYVAQQKIERFQ